MLAAKRAAEQDAERAWQQQRFVKIANCQSASKNPSSTYQCGPTELPSSVNHPCSTQLVTGAQPEDILLANQPRNTPLGGFLQGIFNSTGFQPVKESSPSSGQTANCRLQQMRPDSLDGQAYDADTDSPLSPHELLSLELRAVHQSLASNSNCYPANSQTTNRDNRPHGYRDASACLPGSYTLPWLSSASSASSAPPASCASGASTATPANTTAAAVAARVQSDGSFTSTSVHETRY
ncbi:hypothetical protein PCANC_18140 [Puccinia coronata f. sp. avenae]|uniref:Uncharacterized protein n=1 Tax=Puccinia coronata f. sp. avenae TaxID=200324 RepID=A0A2N5SH35_9BASI|nr:hypothetical protein PCANC_18140 [Puccinia coronata f. sp. avenae]